MRQAAATLAALTLLSATACADGDDPPTDTRPPSPSAEPTTPPRTTAPPPTLPAAATPDQKGAEAFVRHFWDVFTYTYATNDTAPLKAISAPTCRFCAGVAADVDQLAAKGGRTEGGEVEVLRVLAVSPGATTGGIVTVEVRQSAAVTLSASGEELARSEGRPARVAEVAVRRGAGWTVLGVDVRQSDG